MLSKEHIGHRSRFAIKSKRATLERLTEKELDTLGCQMHDGYPNTNWYGLQRFDINLVAKVLDEKERAAK